MSSMPSADEMYDAASAVSDAAAEAARAKADAEEAYREYVRLRDQAAEAAASLLVRRAELEQLLERVVPTPVPGSIDSDSLPQAVE